MTPLQIKTVQKAKRYLCIDDADYRTILRSIGQVDSCTKLSERSFNGVMAYFEERGFDKHPAGDHYWRSKRDGGGTQFCSERQVYAIRALAPQQRYRLPALCLRFSDGRTDREDKLYPQEAWNLIEMLKKAIAREADTAPAPSPAKSQISNPKSSPGLFGDEAPLVGLPDAPSATKPKREPRQRREFSYLGSPITDDEIPF